MSTTETKAYAAQSATSSLASATIPRREPTPREEQIEILHCRKCAVKYRFSIDMASLKAE